MEQSIIGPSASLRPFRAIIADQFESVEELGAHHSSFFSISRQLQRFPDRVDLEPSRDHTINVSMGGCYAVERYRKGRVDRTIERPNAITVIPRGQASSWRAPGLVDVLHIYLDAAALDRFIEREMGAPPDALSVYDAIGWDDEFLRGLAAVLFQEMRQGAHRDGLLLDSFFLVLARHFVRTYTSLRGGRRTTAPRASGLADPKAVDRATRFIHDNLDQNLSFDAVARIAGVSALRLRAAFKATIGQTPHQYMLACRIARAQELLAAGKMPLCEIAYACGFASQSHMTDVFRQKLGVTPGRYRKEVRG